jgi:hypothetical protein
MDPIVAFATAGLAAVVSLAAWAWTDRDRRRPHLIPVRVRSRRQG